MFIFLQRIFFSYNILSIIEYDECFFIGALVCIFNTKHGHEFWVNESPSLRFLEDNVQIKLGTKHISYKNLANFMLKK